MKLNEIVEVKANEVKANDIKRVRKYTGGDLILDNLHLVSLEGCPKRVTGDFNCDNNKLTSFEGCPEIVDGNFECFNNQLTSFEYAPKRINGYVHASHNQFTTFKDIDRHIEQCSMIIAIYTDIASGFSDLFGIDTLTSININNREVQQIINKYLPTKDLIEFQDEMIKSGYESYL